MAVRPASDTQEDPGRLGDRDIALPKDTISLTENALAESAVAPRRRVTLGSGFAPLHHRNFRLFFIGQLISLIGTWMQSTAQAWLIWTLTHNAFMLGAVAAVGSTPVLLFTLFGGVLADRWPKRTVLVCTQTSAMLLAALLGTLKVLNDHGHVLGFQLQVWHVMIVVALLGCVNALDVPTRQAFVVEMVGRRHLAGAIALNSSIFNAARAVGPAVGGVLIGLVGTSTCFFLNAASFLAVIAGLLLMRLEPHVRRPTTESVWRNLAEGFSYIRHTPQVAQIFILVACNSIFVFPFSALMPSFAHLLGLGPEGYGSLLTSIGIGALVSALSLAYFPQVSSRFRTLLIGMIVFPLCVIAFSLSPSYPLSLILLFFTGMAMIGTMATANTVLQTTVPDQLRGRIMSVYAFVFMGMAPLGSLQVGTLAQYFGSPRAVEIGSGICIVAALSLIMWKRLKAEG